MKQHAIPQNILDIEFKLFTKFTVREFIYIAVGVGFGWIFLFLYSKSLMPGIVAIPIFLVSSGIGLFLGIVPINEQNADIFLKNYFMAIRKPTLRVWKSEQFDQKVAAIAEGKGITLTSGSMQREVNLEQGTSSRVVGGTAKGLPQSQFIEQEALDALEQEELERLRAIDEIVGQDLQMSQPVSETQPKLINEITQQAGEITTEQTSTVITPTATTESVAETPLEVSTTIHNEPQTTQDASIPPTLPQEAPAVAQVTSNISEPLVEDVTAQQQAQSSQQAQLSQQPQSPQQTQSSQQTSATPAPQTKLPKDRQTAPAPQVAVPQASITINSETAQGYKTTVEGLDLRPNCVNLYLTASDGKPTVGSMVLIKDLNASIIRVLQTDPQGLVLSDRSLENGEYIIEIKNDNYLFPRVNFIMDGSVIPVINIKSVPIS